MQPKILGIQILLIAGAAYAYNLKDSLPFMIDNF